MTLLFTKERNVGDLFAEDSAHRAFYRFHQLLQRERFWQEHELLTLGKILGEGVVRITGDENDPCGKAPATQLGEHGRAVHLRHDHVRDNKVDLALGRFDDFQSFQAGIGFEHRIAPRSERARGEGAHGLLILDKKDRALPGKISRWLRDLFFRRFVGRARNVARQKDTKDRAAIRLAVDKHIAAGLLDDSVDHREPEAGAFADFLGREKGFENLIAHVARDAVAGILHFDKYIVGLHQRLFSIGGAFIGRHIPRPQGNASAVRHGVARVHDKIDDDLLELIEVSLDEPEIAAVLDLELDPLTDEAAQQILQFRENVGELQYLRPKRLAPRKSEQLPYQASGPIGVLLDLHDVLKGRIRRPMIGEQKVRIADDGGQHIVEVMGDAAGQLTDGLHFLALRKIFLKRALLGRIKRKKRRRGAVLATVLSR